MKPITGRIAYKEFDRLWGRSLREEPLFDSKSILWQMNLPGAAALAALRGLLRRAAVERVEKSFPYSQVAETLLKQQMAVFGAWRIPWRGTTRQWCDGVMIDLGIRALIPKWRSVCQYSTKAIYCEYLRFAQVMGLRTEQLPASVDAFKEWASSADMVWGGNDYRRRALACISNLSPVFWPANIAVIFYLLPAEFWQEYGANLGAGCLRLASCARTAIMELSCSKPEK
jgi:hypothetical protein